MAKTPPITARLILDRYFRDRPANTVLHVSADSEPAPGESLTRWGLYRKSPAGFYAHVDGSPLVGEATYPDEIVRLALVSEMVATNPTLRFSFDGE
jgi:hypothetical protein